MPFLVTVVILTILGTVMFGRNLFLFMGVPVLTIVGGIIGNMIDEALAPMTRDGQGTLYTIVGAFIGIAVGGWLVVRYGKE